MDDTSWSPNDGDRCFTCNKSITPSTGARMMFPEPEGPELMCFECIGKMYMARMKKEDEDGNQEPC